MITLSARIDVFKLAQAFKISRGSRTEIRVVTVELSDGVHLGRGEGVPSPRYDLTPEGTLEQVLSLAPRIESGELDRRSLQDLLKPSAARNALDCAFWDLEAKRAGKRAWDLAGIDGFNPMTTAYTISLDTIEKMGRQAAENADRPLLKLKLAGPEDIERVRAVSENAPDARLIVDANEGWTVEDYQRLAPALKELGVAMIEQPLPAGQDEALRGIDRPISLCADESCHDRRSLEDMIGKYDMINIKLDKTGGLTEALRLKAEAEQAGLDIMVGCMLGSSLGMAPATLVAQGASVVDLDGPLLLSEDRDPVLPIIDSVIQSPESELWG